MDIRFISLVVIFGRVLRQERPTTRWLRIMQ